MTRGEQQTETPRGAVLVPTVKSKFIAANVIDPKDGSVHYHVIPTKSLNILIAAFITLFLAGLVVLGLVTYLKIHLDRNTQQIEELQKEDVVVKP